MTEHEIQNALYHYLRQTNVWPILPNTDVITHFEADLIAITKAGYAHEYEIKLTLSDFRADMKKRCKHASLSGETRQMLGMNGEPIHVLPETEESHSWYEKTSNQCWPDQKPRRFWYVIHGFDVMLRDIPIYAGMLRYLPGQHWSCAFAPIKTAPELKTKKVDPKRISRAVSNMLYRYWTYRTKEAQA